MDILQCLRKLQVGVGRDHTLFALVEGKVKFKRELLQPYPWALMRKGPIHERKFIHVIEKSREPQRLVLVQNS